MDVQNQILLYLIDDALVKLRKKRSASHLMKDFELLRESVQRNHSNDIEKWHGLFQQCHELYGELGGVLTADHWQSPAFDEVGVNEVGDEQGKIIANVNDYKRDQHPTGITYEKAYANEYVVRSFIATPTAYATTSGMAALLVASLIVRHRLPDQYRIAVGAHSYFENQELLHMMFPPSALIPFDEQNPEGLKTIRPNAIFLDTLANDPDMTAAHMPEIFSIARNLGHHVDVVVDATCTSAANVQVPKILGSISVMVFESLNKFHQFGLDRTTGGILWAVGILNDTIYRTRDHAGVNISEMAAAIMPTPNRKMHALYLGRLQKNAKRIEETLKHVPTIRVTYSGGPFVSVEFPARTWKLYQKAIHSMLIDAKKKHVPIVAGSTFGTPITRIYTWSPRSPFEKSFLRIAPGLESPEQMDDVCELIYDTCVKQH